MLDLSRIENDSKAAVHCPTEHDAEEFLNCLKKHYPSKRFMADTTHWDFYGDNTCYWPNFKGFEGLQYGDLVFAMSNNYNVYEIDDLRSVKELPIEASEVNIKSLFGME